LGQLKMSRRWGIWTTSQMKTSSTVMKSGNDSGIAVLDHKESTRRASRELKVWQSTVSKILRKR
jgi:hypothetical protein